MKYTSILFFVLLLIGKVLNAQTHQHDEHHHEHPNNELGIANHLVFLGNEHEFAYGLHLHYLRTFSESKFGAGFGYEQIFDEHSHKTIGIIGSYRPTSGLYFNISPGISFIGPENSTIRFAIHLESTYEIELNHFHLGPAIGFAYDFHDYHLSLGLHLAYGF